MPTFPWVKGTQVNQTSSATQDRPTSVRPNLRRGHFELAVEEPVGRRVMVAVGELALDI
jgi:hypothetical protein